ncbi:hypothetical protein OG946_34830 [Streptomyces sp. NBC_01808]|uniref:molybdopterin dinucleotide binding domain-containing protein n=1 Tax=Streptomyces sp. NBC_01808 TaxID=2975947 RepID=UPI002DD93F96|nr:molybdopterin dinucleotide binding domain-containing protein [Streptomyces sp. NBC_01808]WSA42093.1 hypothetical protein OG946_34830 [Streptomyces sp. NBC_01808]
MTTGRRVYHWHTRTKTARVPELDAAAPHVWVELCPDDARARGIRDGDLVRVTSRRGEVVAPALLTGSRAGTVFVPFHYGYFDQPDPRRRTPAAAPAPPTNSPAPPGTRSPSSPCSRPPQSGSRRPAPGPRPSLLIPRASGEPPAPSRATRWTGG